MNALTFGAIQTTHVMLLSHTEKRSALQKLSKRENERRVAQAFYCSKVM